MLLPTMSRKLRGDEARVWSRAARTAIVVLLAVGVSLLSGCELLRRIGLLERTIESPADAIEYLETRVRREMRRLDIPGFAIAVVDDQNVLWEGYFGVENIETEHPITADTIFRAGSISKILTAIEVMRLRDDGLVDLDAPIEGYLPGFTVRRLFESDEPITVRSLLAHRSGLPRNGTLPLWYWDPGTAVLRELVGSLDDAYAVAPPWTRYKYSNIGYVTLGLLIEELRGGLWPDHMQRALLRPIGMRSSAFLSERLPPHRTIATGYFPVDRRNLPGGEYDIITMPSGNLHASVRDLATLMQFLFRGGRVDAGQLVAAETLHEMCEPAYATPADPQRNGLGWFTDETYLGERVVFHDGTNEGTISYFAMIPDRKLGVVLCATSNAFESIHAQFVFDALDVLRRGLYGIRRTADDDPPTGIEAAQAGLEAFAGTYIVDGERLEIEVSKGGLSASVRGFRLPLSALDETSFSMSHRLIPGGTLLMRFLPSGDAMARIGGTYAVYAPRYPVAEALPEAWRAWLGFYEVHPRHDSRYSDAEVLWTTEIAFEDGLVRSRGDGKVLLPLDGTRACIMGGPFEGEIMERTPGTGIIEWAGFRFVPAAERPRAGARRGVGRGSRLIIAS